MPIPAISIQLPYLRNTGATGVWCKHPHKHGRQKSKETSPDYVEEIGDNIGTSASRGYPHHLGPGIPLKHNIHCIIHSFI